jgi:hypothetical protein
MEGAGKPTRVVRRLVVLALACFGFATTPASGAVTIGQVPANAPSNVSCPAGDYLQPSVTSGNLYIAKQAGRITSWTTYSSGAGTYTFKVFRRTSDPDAFQVVARSSQQALSPGLETFPADIPVRSGDMIGFHRHSTGPGSCTIASTGDTVLLLSDDLPDGASGPFTPLADRRLNLAANLVPSNEFQIIQLSRNTRTGTATIVIQVPNPGVFALSAKGLRKPHVARSLAGAGQLTFRLTPAGKARRNLARKGAVRIQVGLTFAPTNGEPSAQIVGLKLRMKRPARSRA